MATICDHARDLARLHKQHELLSDLGPAALFHLGEYEDAQRLVGCIKTDSQSDCDEIAADFFVPFERIVVEDSMSAVLLKGTHGHGLLNRSWAVCEFFSLRPSLRGSEYVVSGKIAAQMISSDRLIEVAWQRGRSRALDPFVAMRGIQLIPSKVEAGWRLIATAANYGAILVDRHGTFWSDRSPSEESCKDLLVNFQAAALQVVAINSPLNIVVKEERSETLVVRRSDGKGTPKARKRVRYLVLPRRDAYRLVTGDKRTSGDARAAHARRRHWRTLRSERYRPEIRGTRVVVRECWVGPRERVDGDVRYRVCLDLGVPPSERDQVTHLEVVDDRDVAL